MWLLLLRRTPPTELRVLLVGLWCMSTAGLQYSFGTYSKEVVRSPLRRRELVLLPDTHPADAPFFRETSSGSRSPSSPC